MRSNSLAEYRNIWLFEGGKQEAKTRGLDAHGLSRVLAAVNNGLFDCLFVFSKGYRFIRGLDAECRFSLSTLHLSVH